MQRISITNPQNIIDGTAKKYYFKLHNTGGPKGDKGDTGATGPQGPQGPQGNAATVSVGSTTTLPVGQDATVQNVGTLYNAVLNFGIPQGPRGPQGATGATGAKGDKGDQGNPGPQGEKGTNATVYIGTTTTGEPGTQASVYNSGTESNAVLNFTIPRGDVGPSVPLVQETGYSTTKAMSQNATTEALNGKQNTLTAGSNIQISGSTISATDTKYSAGNGITLTGTQFSANTSVLATKNDLGSYYTKTQIDSQMAAKQDDLVAGSNIQIAPDGKTISATDTTYTAGTGLTLTGTEFSADTTVLATQTDLTTALAPKLEAEVVAELPTTGTEGKLYLTPKNYTRGTGTGNPITATITDEAGKMESFKLDGDTYQQTYTGKNLMVPKASAQEKTGITITPNSDGSFTLDGTATAATDFFFAGSWSNRTISYLDMPSGDYTISLLDSAKQQISSPKFRVELYDRMGENSSRILWLQQPYPSPQTTTIASPMQLTASYISIPINQSFTNEKFYIQLEKSSTATSFEKYVGGQASPNPDYPQAIQTVTGEQTVTINSTAYPISLGSIELCKLGDYQGYIWKDGEDWKVHKEISKVMVDGTIGAISNPSANRFNIDNLITNYKKRENSQLALCDRYITIGQAYNNAQFNTLASNYECCIDLGCGAASVIRFKNTKISTSSDFAAALEANPLTLYYVLATPTDTTITDQTLIAQLEAIRTASLENGANTITNTATGTNLAGDMEIGYYGFNPTNRYDKFIWLDLNNNYEQIGS